MLTNENLRDIFVNRCNKFVTNDLKKKEKS